MYVMVLRKKVPKALEVSPVGVKILEYDVWKNKSLSLWKSFVCVLAKALAQPKNALVTPPPKKKNWKQLQTQFSTANKIVLAQVQPKARASAVYIKSTENNCNHKRLHFYKYCKFTTFVITWF
jgi:hypothetical protein